MMAKLNQVEPYLTDFAIKKHLYSEAKVTLLTSLSTVSYSQKLFDFKGV